MTVLYFGSFWNTVFLLLLIYWLTDFWSKQQLFYLPSVQVSRSPGRDFWQAVTNVIYVSSEFFSPQKTGKNFLLLSVIKHEKSKAQQEIVRITTNSPVPGSNLNSLPFWASTCKPKSSDCDQVFGLWQIRLKNTEKEKEKVFLYVFELEFRQSCSQSGMPNTSLLQESQWNLDIQRFNISFPLSAKTKNFREIVWRKQNN